MKTFLTMTVLLAMGLSAHAEEEQSTAGTTSTIKASEIAPTGANEATQEQIDKEITNAKLRAEMGSKSRWSIKTALGYSGGSVERPLAEVRPNYRAGAQVPALASLSGTVGVKYALGLRDSLSLGTGLTMNTPFSGAVDRNDMEDPRGANKNIHRIEVSTPSLTYTHATKLGDVQWISSGAYYHATDSDSVDGLGMSGYLGFSQTAVTEIGATGWSLGGSFSIYKFLYHGDQSPAFIAKGSLQEDFEYGIFPFAEYSFNDTYSFRTVFGYFQLIKYRGGGADGAVDSYTPYQSMGIGISVSRDIYLYPNIQFTPLDIRADRTNVALSTNINVF